MTKKKILIISAFSIAILAVVLSLIVYIISLPQKASEVKKPKFEYGEYTLKYEEDYEPGATTTYYLHKDGSIEFTRTRYCSAKDCEPETTELKKLEFSEENLKLTYRFLVSLLSEEKEKTIYNSQIKDDKTSSMLFYIRDEREILIPLEMSNYDYKLELLKGHDFHLIYLKDDKIDVANIIYEDFDLENIKTHTLDFENTKVVKNFIKEQFDKNETFKNIYYTGYSYKEKLIIDAMLENNEEYIANIDEAKELLYTLTYSGMDCLTPTMDIYNDKSYDYNYTYTLDGSEPTPKKGTYDYDINKLLKTTEYDSIPDHPAGHFNLINKDTRYFLGFEDKDLDDFLASAGLTKDSFMCSLELE